MPDVLRVAAHEPFSARALVYALLLDPRADPRDLQLARLKAGAEPQDFVETLRLVAPVQALPFDAALQTLNQSVPAIKRRIVVACAACILANQQVTVREAELLRAICDTLDYPLPPLVVGEAEGRGTTSQPGGL
jgi:hypothetical protein